MGIEEPWNESSARLNAIFGLSFKEGITGILNDEWPSNYLPAEISGRSQVVRVGGDWMQR